MFLLDTNVVSALRRRDRAPPRVLAWASKVPADDLFISAITILEIEQGVLLIGRRDRRQAAVFERWLRTFLLPSFGERTIPFDAAAALRCAALHVPNSRPERDAMIAATAIEHRMTVVTRNIRDFAPMGVPVLNPWEDAKS